jgi:hypothetical protein
LYTPRRIETSPTWLDSDGVKLYTISATGKVVSHSDYLPQLQVIKQQKQIDWSSTPSFAIFHEGARARYLVLAWWANENEMFTSVSVLQGSQWVEDPGKYSFCLWDLEIFWAERNTFVDTMYSGQSDLDAYRLQRLSGDRRCDQMK